MQPQSPRNWRTPFSTEAEAWSVGGSSVKRLDSPWPGVVELMILGRGKLWRSRETQDTSKTPGPRFWGTFCTFSAHSLHILCTFCTLSTNFRLLDLEPNWVESSETPHVTSFLGWKGKQSSEGEFQNHFLTGGVWSEFAPLCLPRAVSTRGVLDDLGWRKRQSFAMWIRWQISVMDLCDGSYLFRT